MLQSALSLEEMREEASERCERERSTSIDVHATINKVLCHESFSITIREAFKFEHEYFRLQNASVFLLLAISIFRGM